MTGISSLKLVSSTPVRSVDPKLARRKKLCKKLLEQLEMARGMKAGERYEVIVSKRVRDAETGEHREVRLPKKIKAWWWTAEDGKTCLTLRYGAKPLELVKGRNAIEADGIDGVIASLEVVQKAVLAGELDEQIQALAARGRSQPQTSRATLTLRKQH